MGCNDDKQTLTIRKGVWTDGSQTAIFHPFLQLSTNEYENVRLSFNLMSNTGKLTASRATRTSVDGVNWSAATDYGAGGFISTEGWSFPTGYNSPDAGAILIEFGFDCKNTDAGTLRESAEIVALFDLRKT